MKRQKCKLLCLLVAVVVLLSSCLDGQYEVSHGKQSSEASDAQLADNSSSLADDTDESSESSLSSEAISEEPHEDESSDGECFGIEYQEEITEEMANAFLKFVGIDRTIHEHIAVYWAEGEFDYRNSYTAIGNLNGYTLCEIDGHLEGLVAPALTHYTAGDYVFLASCISSPSNIGLYLYKDLKFITFADAYEQGLFDPKDAYELMKDRFKNSVKKLSDLPNDEAEYYRQHQYGVT